MAHLVKFKYGSEQGTIALILSMCVMSTARYICTFPCEGLHMDTCSDFLMAVLSRTILSREIGSAKIARAKTAKKAVSLRMMQRESGRSRVAPDRRLQNPPRRGVRK